MVSDLAFPQTTVGFVDSRRRHGCLSWTSVSTTSSSCIHVVRSATLVLRDHFASCLLEQIFLKGSCAAEELVISLSVFFCGVLDRGKFDCAEVIRHLLQSVIGHRCLSSLDTSFGEDEADRLVECLLDDVLPVVVVDFHLVEFLEELTYRVILSAVPSDWPWITSVNR